MSSGIAALPRALLPLLAAAALSLACLGSAYDTTNGYFQGYRFAGNVEGYVNMTMDFCEIKAKLQAGQFADALAVYVNGSNSARGAGKRSFGTTWALAETNEQMYYDLLEQAGNGDGTWLDAKVKAAFGAGNPTAILKTIIPAIHVKYILHEVDEGLEGTEEGATSDASGAPHNVDEAWAMYAGGHPAACDSPYLTAHRLASDMGTLYEGEAKTNLAITKAFTSMQAAARAGEPAAASYNTSRAVLYHQLLATMVQGVLREAKQAELCSRSNNKAEADNALSAASAYWDVARVFLLQPQYSGVDTQAIERALQASPISYKKVSKALSAGYKKMALTEGMVGKPRVTTCVPSA